MAGGHDDALLVAPDVLAKKLASQAGGGRARSCEDRERVTEHVPSDARSRERVVTRAHSVRIVERRDRHVDLVGKTRRLEGELRPTTRAKCAAAVVGGAKRRRLTRRKRKLRAPDREPSNERRAARAPTNRAVAARLVRRRPARLVAHEPTQTASFHAFPTTIGAHAVPPARDAASRTARPRAARLSRAES